MVDKGFLVAQLVSRMRESVRVSEREMVAAADAAVHGEEAQAKREDSRAMLEYSALARGQSKRLEAGRQMLAALDVFRAEPVPDGGRIGLGALVEVEDDDDGTGRTLFIAPVGAGLELEGPGGDGFFTVVTPGSPLGLAVMGQRLGDSVDVTVDGETRSWTITWVM